MSVRRWFIVFLCMGAGWVNAGSPPFSGKDINGKVHSLDDYAGKMVLVNYWAT